MGHDWQVKSRISTEYDDSGQLIQEGCIIYECSRCGEQYKDTSGEGLIIGDDSQSLELVNLVRWLQSCRSGLSEAYLNFSALFAELFVFIPDELKRIFYWGMGASVLAAVTRVVRGR